MMSRKATALFSGLIILCSITYTSSRARYCPSCSKITVARWLNLLRYAQKSLAPEPVTDHEEHYNRTEHIQLIADSIIKHFYNNIFTPNFSPDGEFSLLRERRPVDFLILLDSSSSIGSENFQHALTVLRSWVDVLSDEDFSSDKLRVSMISFSEPDRLHHEFPFTSFQDKQQVMDSIASSTYHNGTSTSTALGLRFAESIFRAAPKRNATSSQHDATRVLLLATDGWSNDVSIPFGVLWPAAKLKVGLGVQVYVLGIGDQLNHNSMAAVASKPPDYHLFEVADYDMMTEIMEKVRQLHADQEERYQDQPT